MPDVEKVIKGLESHIKADCAGCPYREGGYTCYLIMTDALALLNELEPRVIRLRDAEAMRLCWVERRFPHTIRPAQIMRFGDDSPNITIFSIHQIPTDWPVCEFGSEWRCWDKEPTNEQMERVKWDE